ncbi:MAG: hypothetical protein CSA95_08390 [Bacteroidetes bacterium]|nr:MAG: hypothetical protein CSA95_08390 [Bacteroidota bacterium]PIE88341.1 MAG: hypothetical protein CSA04_02385 [Bacteroidota bacterium]
MGIGKRFFRLSKWYHKYPGLLLILFVGWMAVSGILLNHPGLIRDLSIPGRWVPKHYHPVNWNRSSLKGMLRFDSRKLMVWGNQGVFLSKDNGLHFEPFMEGDFPDAAWKRRTNHLLADSSSGLVWAATNGGLFQVDCDTKQWVAIPLPENRSAVKKIVTGDGHYLVVTESAIYQKPLSSEEQFSLVIPHRDEENLRLPLFRFFLSLHDGSILGGAGKLLWDLAGLILLFLAVSAFYIWFYPKRWRRGYKKGGVKPGRKEKKRYAFFLRYHKKWGWYVAVLLTVIFATGIFLRPPLILAIADGSVSQRWLPSFSRNPWHEKINNALYDHDAHRLVLECSDGIWAGAVSEMAVFKKLELPFSIFAMGTTVFEEKVPGEWLVGSFGGLLLYDVREEHKQSLLHVSPPKHKGMPASLLVTGFVEYEDNCQYICGHYKGLCDASGEPIYGQLIMPESLSRAYRMPLWNFLFELHNARIFKGLLGALYILIIPLLGSMGLFVILSGVFDYWYVKLKRK